MPDDYSTPDWQELREEVESARYAFNGATLREGMQEYCRVALIQEHVEYLHENRDAWEIFANVIGYNDVTMIRKIVGAYRYERGV